MPKPQDAIYIHCSPFVNRAGLLITDGSQDHLLLLNIGWLFPVTLVSSFSPEMTS